MAVEHVAVRILAQLDGFSKAVEAKLMTIHARVHRLDLEMRLIEAKLASIDQQQPSVAAAAPAAHTAHAAAGTAAHAAAAPFADAAAPPPTAPPPEPEPAPAELRAADDPRLAKYLKMLRVGVGLPQVASKVAQEMPGIDASFLEDPSGPSPLPPLEAEE